MSDDVRIPDAHAEAYAAALHALARADGEITAAESTHLEQLLAKRSGVTIDAESLFFSPSTPESFGAAVRKDPGGKAIAKALIADAVSLAASDGDLNGKEATAIMRYARALGLTPLEVHDISALLDEWSHQLG